MRNEQLNRVYDDNIIHVASERISMRAALEKEAAFVADKLFIDLKFGLTFDRIQPYLRGKTFTRNHLDQLTKLLFKLDRLYGITKENEPVFAAQYAGWIEALVCRVFEVFEYHEVHLVKYKNIVNQKFQGQHIPPDEYVALAISN
jgi:hypothetical protein